MSTFIEIRPTQHATIKTTGVRIDGNFKVTVRTETGGVATDHKVNFSGLLTDQTLQGTDPIGQVRVGKIGTQERVFIQVNAYYASGEEDKVPAAGLYWYNIKNHYPFGGTPEQGKTASADPNFNTPQTFPIVIFNESTLTAWTANSATSTVPSRLYGQLGTLDNRRQYLKQLILKNVDNPMLPMWSLGMVHSPVASNATLLQIAGYLKRIEIISYWLEMLTGAISVDVNLNSEQKFNLLKGECELSVRLIARNLPDGGTYGAQSISRAIFNFSSRNSYTYFKIGDVGGAPDYQYTRTNWLAVPSTNPVITMNGSADIGMDWVTWLRT